MTKTGRRVLGVATRPGALSAELLLEKIPRPLVTKLAQHSTENWRPFVSAAEAIVSEESVRDTLHEF